MTCGTVPLVLYLAGLLLLYRYVILYVMLCCMYVMLLYRYVVSLYWTLVLLYCCLAALLSCPAVLYLRLIRHVFLFVMSSSIRLIDSLCSSVVVLLYCCLAALLSCPAVFISSSNTSCLPLRHVFVYTSDWLSVFVSRSVRQFCIVHAWGGYC